MKTVDALRNFEELVEGLVEGSVAEAFAGRLQPVEIAKRLGRALDAGQTVAADKILGPNDFTVSLNPKDFASIAPFRQGLQRELAAYLDNLARERGISFLAPPRVTLIEDADVRARRVRVMAVMSDAAPLSAVEAPVPQVTAPLPVKEVQARLKPAGRLELADGRIVPVDKPAVSLGRSLDNDVVFDDGRVSRHHAQIRVVHNRFCLFDLASANGTLVNGQPVQQVVLRDGDRISLGGAELVFRDKIKEASGGA